MYKGVFVFGVVLFISLYHCCLCAEYDYTVEVAAGRSNCYWIPITDPKHVQMEMDYQVIDGGDLDITFYLKDPFLQVLVADVRKTDSLHTLDIKNVLGDYEFCFDNSFSYQSSKVVFFEVILFDAEGNSDETNYSDLAHAGQAIKTSMDDFRQTSVRIKNNLNKAEHFQSKIRAAEYRDRSVLEANFDRVNFWSMINMFIMIGVLLLQVFMVRSLFIDESRVGKLIRKGMTMSD